MHENEGVFGWFLPYCMAFHVGLHCWFHGTFALHSRPVAPTPVLLKPQPADQLDPPPVAAAAEPGDGAG